MTGTEIQNRYGMDGKAYIGELTALEGSTNPVKPPAAPNSPQPPHSITNIKFQKWRVYPAQPVILVLASYPNQSCGQEYPHHTDKLESMGYPICKSFRRDILRGYLQNTPFVFIDLGGKRIFGGIYHLVCSKHVL
jgi:hypothetical protein